MKEKTKRRWKRAAWTVGGLAVAVGAGYLLYRRLRGEDDGQEGVWRHVLSRTDVGIHRGSHPGLQLRKAAREVLPELSMHEMLPKAQVVVETPKGESAVGAFTRYDAMRPTGMTQELYRVEGASVRRLLTESGLKPGEEVTVRAAA